MNNTQWTLVNGKNRIDYSTFPYAFRQGHLLIETERKANRPTLELIKTLKILGPVNARKERSNYSWPSATELAMGNGLLAADGTLNSKEFKHRPNQL